MKAIMDNTHRTEYDIVVGVCVLSCVYILYLDILIKKQRGKNTINIV